MDDVARSLPSALARRWFLLGLLALFIGVSIQYTLKVDKHGPASSAFNRWRRQVLAMDRGVDPYQTFAYPNPPMMALILLPYYQVPELPGALAWYYTKVALTLLALVWIFRLVEDTERPFPGWAKALTVLLSLKPILGDLTHGNVNLLILFLVIAALYAFHQRYDLTGGLMLGLAIVCKVTPALFVPYFIWKRAWRTLAGCGVGLVLFFLVIPGCYFGPARNFALLGSWSDLMIRPVLKGKVEYSDYANQSLAGLAKRMLTHSPSVVDWTSDGRPQPVRYDNFTTLPETGVRLLLFGAVVLFAAAAILACRTPIADRQNWRFAAEAGIVLLGMLLFCERTWKHHCVTLTLPFAVICYRLAWAKRASARDWLIAVLVGAVGSMAATSTIGVPELDELARRAQIYGAYVWAFAILTASLTVMLWQERRTGRIVAQPADSCAARQVAEAA
jgi:hypothetical protein